MTLRDRLAIYLMAINECSMGDDPKSHVAFFETYLREQRNAKHTGDCKKEPWTCTHCVCDEYLAKADQFIVDFPTLRDS